MEVKTWKDRPRWFIVGMFVFVHQVVFLLLSFFSACFPPHKVICVLLFFCFFYHCGCFCSSPDARGRGAVDLWKVGSPHFPVVWRNPSFASKWKLCLNLSEEVHFYWCCWLLLLYKQHKCENLGASIRSRLTASWRCPAPQSRKASEAFLVLDVQSC